VRNSHPHLSPLVYSTTRSSKHRSLPHIQVHTKGTYCVPAEQNLRPQEWRNSSTKRVTVPVRKVHANTILSFLFFLFRKPQISDARATKCCRLLEPERLPFRYPENLRTSTPNLLVNSSRLIRIGQRDAVDRS